MDRTVEWDAKTLLSHSEFKSWKVSCTINSDKTFQYGIVPKVNEEWLLFPLDTNGITETFKGLDQFAALAEGMRIIGEHLMEVV